jgi:hypothetical protein
MPSRRRRNLTLDDLADMHEMPHHGCHSWVDNRRRLRFWNLSSKVAKEVTSRFKRTAYEDFCKCIYRNRSKLDRVRQLVVNSVMATDIVDKELGTLRKTRWETALNKEEKDSGAWSSRRNK